MGSYGYGTYNAWSATIPLSLTVVGIVIGLLLVPLTYILLSCCRKSDHFILLLYYFSKIIFRDSLKRASETTYFLHDYVLRSDHYIVVFSTVTTVALNFVFISFWASFFVEGTFVCSSSLDCFVTNSSTREADPADYSPIQDCMDVDSNATVVCFQFVFNLAEGLASGVGFLTAAVAYVYVLGVLLAWVSETHKKSFNLIISIVWIIIVFIVYFTFLTVSITVPLFADVIFRTPEKTLKWFLYITGFMYISLLMNPYMLFVFEVILNHFSRVRSSSSESSQLLEVHKS